MAFTQSQLDAIERAIVSGSRRVKFEDREVEFKSTTELLRIRDLIQRELGITSDAGRTTRAQYDKDLS